MNILEFTSIVWLGSLIAGFLGSLTGLGGGVVIVPFLTLVFGVDIRYAIGASLVSVIATSSGAAAAYVKEGFTNIRIGMFLEIATTMGALIGAALAVRVSTAIIAVIFGMVLIYSAYLSSRPKLYRAGDDHPDRLATILRMDGSYPSLNGLDKIPRTRDSRRFRPDVYCRRPLGPPWDRFRGRKGSGDGSGHAYSVQGFHDYLQFHDRRDRCSQCGCVS